MFLCDTLTYCPETGSVTEPRNSLFWQELRLSLPLIVGVTGMTALPSFFYMGAGDLNRGPHVAG